MVVVVVLGLMGMGGNEEGRKWGGDARFLKKKIEN